MYRVLSDKRLVGIPYENITRLYNESCINIKDELRNVSRINDIKNADRLLFRSWSEYRQQPVKPDSQRYPYY
ncbi:MAG: hypothetical protein WDO19_04745 [Bacteroidota bacterium]